MLYCRFSLVNYFIHSSIYMSIPIFQFITPCPTWHPCICSLYLCIYFCFVKRFTCTIFSRFHLCCAVQCLVTQSLPILCGPMDFGCQAPLSMGIFQARILEWTAISSSRASSQPRYQTHISCTGRQIPYC